MFGSDLRLPHLTLPLAFQLLLLGVTLSLFVAGCAENSAPALERATTLSVKPSSATLVKGDSVQMKAAPRNSRRDTVLGYEITWASKEDTVATVDTSGTVVAQNLGSTSISATAEKEGTELLSSRSEITVMGPQTSSLRVSTSTSGDTLDPNGYKVVVADSISKDIGLDESATFSDLAEGEHSVELLGIASNCSVDGQNPKTVLVTAGNPSSTSFPISCTSSSNSDLTVHPENPHYLQDGSNTVFLIGGGTTVYPAANLANDKEHIDTWAPLGINFARVWTILPWLGENTVYPWARTGPGTANDGGPKFDLTKFNQEFFDRHDELLTHNPDFYLQYMLFDEVGLERGDDRWDQHPFNPANNINNLGLPSTGGDAVPEFYYVSDADLMQIQEDYVRKVINELNNHPNIIYEIANETSAPWDWQKKWIDFINNRSGAPIANNPFGSLSDNLNYEPLDIVNYHNLDETNTNSILLRDRSAGKVLKFDEQATSGLNDSGIRQVAWQAFTGGGHIHWDALGGSSDQNAAQTTSNYLASFINENGIDPAKMAPDNSLVDNGFALVDPGAEYIVFIHSGSSVTINLGEASGSLTAKWYNTGTGKYSESTTVTGGGSVALMNPFGTDVVLYIEK